MVLTKFLILSYMFVILLENLSNCFFCWSSSWWLGSAKSLFVFSATLCSLQLSVLLLLNSKYIMYPWKKLKRFLKMSIWLSYSLNWNLQHSLMESQREVTFSTHLALSHIKCFPQQSVRRISCSFKLLKLRLKSWKIITLTIYP